MSIEATNKEDLCAEDSYVDKATDVINLSDIHRPYIPYDFYCNVMRESRSLKSYLGMIIFANSANFNLNADRDKKIALLKAWFDTFDKDSWLIQAYKHKIVANIDKFYIIISPVGFLDYIDVDESGYVTVNMFRENPLDGMNTYGMFNEMLETFDQIPILLRDTSLFKDIFSIPSEVINPDYELFYKRVKQIGKPSVTEEDFDDISVSIKAEKDTALSKAIATLLVSIILLILLTPMLAVLLGAYFI